MTTSGEPEREFKFMLSKLLWIVGYPWPCFNIHLIKRTGRSCFYHRIAWSIGIDSGPGWVRLDGLRQSSLILYFSWDHVEAIRGSVWRRRLEESIAKREKEQADSGGPSVQVVTDWVAPCTCLPEAETI